MKPKKYFTDEEFFMWFNTEATDEEKTLTEKADNYGYLFKDFLLQDMKFCIADIPMELELVTCTLIVCRIRKLKGCDGIVKRNEKALTLSSACKDGDSVLLHEMTHVYENILDSFSINYHEFVFIHLYRKLRKKKILHKHLDVLIDSYSDPYGLQKLHEQGGKHDILFFLKCLDLDITQKYPLGTTMGYGYVETIKDIMNNN